MAKSENSGSSGKKGTGGLSVGTLVARIAGFVAVAALIIVIWVVVSNGIDELNKEDATTTEQTTDDSGNESGPKHYVVQPGDNLEVISEETGVPVDELLALNPDIDARTLPEGYKLKLR